MTEESALYWTSTEFAPSRGHPAADFEGGFVYAFMLARDAREAITRLEAGLREEHLSILRVEFVEPYADMSWDTPEEKAEFDALGHDALSSGSVVFGDFYVYRQRNETDA